MTAPDANADFSRTLLREILASEIRRGRILAATLVVLAACVTLTLVVAHDTFQRFAVKPVSWWMPLRIIVPFIVYECVFIAAMTYFARHGKQPPWPARYANATIETSLPSVVLLAASGYAEPSVIFGGWPSFLYFIFILAATLRLNFALPMLTGAVAAAGYMAVAAYVLPLSFAADQPILNPIFHVGRALIMLGAGLVAGLVAMQLRSNLVRVLEESAARDRVINLFGQHVSPAVVDRLLDRNVATESEARQVCVMFLDIRGFTAFARQRTPTEVVDSLNREFAFMIEAVDRHQGIVNKFLGDGFMAIFGAPLADPGASRHAVDAAREILAEIDRRAAAGEAQLGIGIGLHHGIAVTGNIGSPRRKEFTVIGDVVNLASRIEQLNKTFGSRLLISAEVAESLGPALGDAAPLSATVKGYAEPIAVWRLD
jgi:adenylate cyclase